jgi:hypothetical protein
MDGEIFFRQQARECREAAAKAEAADSRALLQRAKYYEKEARNASGEAPRQGMRAAELNRY